MARLIAQAVLATSLLNIVPSDAADVERRASLPSASPRPSATLVDGFALALRRLPPAADALRPPRKVDHGSLGVVTSARSALVIDRVSGRVLFEKNAQEPRSIGSITKLMTAFVFLEGDPDLDAEASIEPSDLRTGATQHVATRDAVRVRDLLHASLVGSDNSATVALARLSGLSLGDFVARMNERAAGFGMQGTTFVDPAGLSPDNRSVVADLARLIDETTKVPEIRDAVRLSSVAFTGSSGRAYRIASTNELLESFVNRPPYAVVGGKTGFLPEAGYCFGAVFSQDGRREIVVVVLGSDSKEGRFRDAKALTAWAYKVFEWPDDSLAMR